MSKSKYVPLDPITNFLKIKQFDYFFKATLNFYDHPLMH